MNNPNRTLSPDAEFITVDQAKIIFNLGTTTIKRLAKECGCIRKIGRSLRLNKKILADYIDSHVV